MKLYLHERENTGRKGSLIGLVLTVGIHLSVILLCLFTGLKYLYPPPVETTFLIEFEEAPEEEVEVKATKTGREPQGDKIDKEKEVELVQKAESPHTGDRKNQTPVSKPDPHGDVETPTPEKEPVTDPRASFPGMSEKPSTATTPHNADESKDTFKEGEADGNTPKGKVSGSANAHVQGRTLKGVLVKPSYNTQMEGKVVVRIKVDQYGNVIDAQAGVAGTTVTDKGLWNAARGAALKAKFNQVAGENAPAVQEGTITYIFKVVA